MTLFTAAVTGLCGLLLPPLARAGDAPPSSRMTFATSSDLVTILRPDVGPGGLGGMPRAGCPHAHHIQRLMVTGNFALLAGCDPHQVHEWDLEVYVDAYEWVEQKY